MVMQECSCVYTFDRSVEKYYLGRQPAGVRENCTLDTCFEQPCKMELADALVWVRVAFLVFVLTREQDGWRQSLPAIALNHGLTSCFSRLSTLEKSLPNVVLRREKYRFTPTPSYFRKGGKCRNLKFFSEFNLGSSTLSLLSTIS